MYLFIKCVDIFSKARSNDAPIWNAKNHPDRNGLISEPISDLVRLCKHIFHDFMYCKLKSECVWMWPN